MFSKLLKKDDIRVNLNLHNKTDVVKAKWLGGNGLSNGASRERQIV